MSLASSASGLTIPSDCLRAAVRGVLVREQRLTPRELEVLELFVEGLSRADVARVLLISQRTLDTHVQSLYAKIGTGHRSGLVAAWVRLVYEAIDALTAPSAHLWALVQEHRAVPSAEIAQKHP